MVRTTWAWQTVSFEIYLVFFFIITSVRRDNINRLQDSRISIDSEADTNGKIRILLSFLNLCLRCLEPDLAFWFLGFLTMVFQDFCLNLSKTKTKLQASIATPRNHQYNERRNHNCTLLFTEYISVIKNFVLFCQFECGSDFEKIFSFGLQWLGFYVYFLT